jgi:hypothetical protein
MAAMIFQNAPQPVRTYKDKSGSGLVTPQMGGQMGGYGLADDLVRDVCDDRDQILEA